MRATILAAAALALTAGAHGEETVPDQLKVRVDTSLGSFVVELDHGRAPRTVENFLSYVDESFYEGTIFHRVINGFVAQGGGYTTNFVEKPTRDPVINEAGNGLQNDRGTVGMARANAPHSANSQFYVNLVDNDSLNPLPSRWGYAVFGRVVEGMEVVDKIGLAPTGPGGAFEKDVPQTPIVIERIVRLDGTSSDAGASN